MACVYDIWGWGYTKSPAVIYSASVFNYTHTFPFNFIESFSVCVCVHVCAFMCICVCACAFWIQYVQDCVISKPEPSQVETLLSLRPPGNNFSLWKFYTVYECMHVCVCWAQKLPHGFVLQACVWVPLCVGVAVSPHPAVYGKVIEAMEKDGPVMT